MNDNIESMFFESNELHFKLYRKPLLEELNKTELEILFGK